MQFIDQAEIQVQAGNGGDGMVALDGKRGGPKNMTGASGADRLDASDL